MPGQLRFPAFSLQNRADRETGGASGWFDLTTENAKTQTFVCFAGDCFSESEGAVPGVNSVPAIAGLIVKFHRCYAQVQSETTDQFRRFVADILGFRPGSVGSLLRWI
jgi:hypothetical protein